MREWKGKEGREEGRGKREEKMPGGLFFEKKRPPAPPSKELQFGGRGLREQLCDELRGMG